MFDFPGLVQFLFLLLVITLAILIFRFFRQPSPLLTQEKRALYLLISLLGLFVISLLVSVKLSSWKDAYRNVKTAEVEQQRLTLDEQDYLQKSYQPLALSYKRLAGRIREIRQLKEKIQELRAAHPNHARLLDSMLEAFTGEEALQTGLHKKVSVEIRNAILHSRTQDENYVQKRFHERARELHQEIHTSKSRLDKQVTAIATALEESLEEASEVLTGSMRSGKQRKVRNYSFDRQAQVALFNFIENYKPEMAAGTGQIMDEIIQARQRKDTIRDLAQQDDDELREPLRRTGQLWQDAENGALKQLGEILYAVEAAYLARQFNMPEYNPDYRNLMRALAAKTGSSLQEIRRTRLSVERSFSSPEYVKHSRNRN